MLNERTSDNHMKTTASVMPPASPAAATGSTCTHAHAHAMRALMHARHTERTYLGEKDMYGENESAPWSACDQPGCSMNSDVYSTATIGATGRYLHRPPLDGSR